MHRLVAESTRGQRRGRTGPETPKHRTRRPTSPDGLYPWNGLSAYVPSCHDRDTLMPAAILLLVLNFLVRAIELELAVLDLAMPVMVSLKRWVRTSDCPVTVKRI